MISVVAGGLILLAVFQLNGFIQLGIPGDRVLATGLSAILVSYFVLLVSILVWMLEKGTGREIDDDLLDELRSE